MSTRTTLRPARPDLDEGRAFARYLDTAAEGFFRFMLGPRSEDILARAYREPDHDLSHENVTFAEHGDSIVGMVLGYSSEQHRRSSKRPLEEAAGWLNLRLRVVSTLFSPLMRIIEDIPVGDFYIQALAVDEIARGAGLGSLLLDAIEERARDVGATRLALDVSASNTTARRLYEHRGWTIESQWPARIAIPKLRFFRLIRVL